MKKIICAVMAVLTAACGSNAKETELAGKPEGRVLVVYFSESPNRNTHAVAMWIHQAVGGDIQAIEMVEPYTGSYREIVNRSRQEFRNSVHPQIKPFKHNVADYDVIFIGSPIWFNTYAPPVATFLAGNDFTGKIIVPFCTHGGHGAGNFYDDIRDNTQGAVLPGFTARGSNQIERRMGRGTKDKLSKNDVVIWL
ncbi:MAG: NAD(P)H-dependent oxidoreductase, partial [Alphaproteobacteria bacterium]|nr:NAD(P)H-dependent oxidoreductase [Alphaproteobacteria bacterium]